MTKIVWKQMLPLPGTLILIGLVTLSLARAQDEKITIEPREKWTNFFAGSKADFHFMLKGADALKGRVEWTLADAGTKRVFPRGRGEAPIAAGPLKISLNIPTVNAGVVLQAQLVVSVVAAGQEKPAATYEKTLWIFPANPFTDRLKWLEELKINLFDPDPKSKTAEALKGLKVPFEEVRNAAALGELKEGLVLVGEGVSFNDEVGLAEALVQAASRGRPVLCLAPAAGSFPLPEKNNGLPSPASLNLQRQDIIRKLDKRLDADAWAPDNQVAASSLELQAEDGKVVGVLAEGAKGWPWLQLDYPDKNCRLVLCGFALVRRWEAGPAPRYLLARLLEHVTDLTVSESKNNSEK
jgi:hypothetical protein